MPKPRTQWFTVTARQSHHFVVNARGLAKLTQKMLGDGLTVSVRLLPPEKERKTR